MEKHIEPPSWLSLRALVVILSAAVLLAVVLTYTITARGRGKTAETTATMRPAAPQSSAPPILTRDPDFLRLIDPASDQDWGLAKKSAYVQQSPRSSADAFPAAMQAILTRDRADWFEVGHVTPSGSSNIAITPVDASPLALSHHATLRISPSALNSVYARFDTLTDPEIERTLPDQVQARSCDQQLKNICRSVGGPSVRCSDPAELAKIRAQIQFSCVPGPSIDQLRQQEKSDARANRLVLVGQGDLPSHRLDKLMLVDYDTGAIFLELPPDALIGRMRWKPLIQSAWTNRAAPPEVGPAERAPVDTDRPASAPITAAAPVITASTATALNPAASASPGASGESQAISNALSAWASAEESNVPATLAACYAGQIDRYFLRRDVTRGYVLDYLTNLFRRDRRRVVTFQPKDVALEDASPDQVKVRLVKEVVIRDDERTSERFIHSILFLRKEGAEWKIASEQDLK